MYFQPKKIPDEDSCFIVRYGVIFQVLLNNYSPCDDCLSLPLFEEIRSSFVQFDAWTKQNMKL